MLTADLLRVRLQKGELTPSFVDPANERLLTRATELIDAFRDHVGKRRDELDAAVTHIAGDGTDHKLTRGLAKLLADKATFDVASPVDPAELRARVFREATRQGPLAERAVEGGLPTATTLLAAIGAELGLEAAAVAEALYADHADQQILQEAPVYTPAGLLHRYNLALVQSALLRCVELSFTVTAPTPARLRQLLRALKFHQLLFSAAATDGGYTLTIDGPTSLFHHTTRYGMGLANVFPALILHPGPWAVEAKLAWGNRKPVMKLTPAHGLVSHYRDLGAYDTREAKWFEERFLALDSGWALTRDGPPLLQGTEGVVVPDFTFTRDGKVAHLEILGFWRKGTVARRLALLRKHGPSNLILAVSRKLCAGEAEELPDAVVPFAEVIPAKEVLRRIEASAMREDGGGPARKQGPRPTRPPRRA